MTREAFQPVFTVVKPGALFSTFQPVSADEIVEAVRRLPDKTSSADRILTFPAVYKEVIVTPLLKKPGFDASANFDHGGDVKAAGTLCGQAAYTLFGIA